MDAITEDNQSRDFRLDDQNLDNLRAKAEAAMPFLKDDHSTYVIQRHTRNVTLSTAGKNKKYFAALLSLPVDDREGEIVAYIIIHVINVIKALLTILIKLRGPPITSGTIEDILSLEELKTFMAIVFEKFKNVFYIENNLIDSAENVVYTMILLNMRTICNNGVVDPACVSSWRGIADVLKGKRGFASRYYSFLTSKGVFRNTFNPKKHHNEYLVIYRKERGDFRSVLYSGEGFSELEQTLSYEYGNNCNYDDITKKIFMSFKQPELSIEDRSAYRPVIPYTYLGESIRSRKRGRDSNLVVPPETQFRRENADALTAFLNKRAINAQPDPPLVQHEDDEDDEC